MKAKLIMCQGLPGSGKTKWSKEEVLGSQMRNDDVSQWIVRVSKDEIRAALATEGWVWSQEAEEKDVLPRRDALIRSLLAAGRTVIEESTNFGRKHKVRLQELARQAHAEFEIKRFDVPLETCLERNALRTGSARVPDEVIRGMYMKFVVKDSAHFPLSAAKEPPIVPVEPDEHLMKAIICDLDGTLSLNNGHRRVYDHQKADMDEPNLVVKRCLEVYYRFMNYQIVYLTGREERFREPTETFLRKHYCPPGPLWMRATDDTRKDSIVKRELFDEHVRGKYNVEFVLDDRDQVVAMWRELGLQCWQVAPGDF